MTRRSFAHTERPQGSPGPYRPSKALDALSALAKRGSADIKGEQLQKPLQQRDPGQYKPPSPVALEAMNRSAPPPQQPMQQPMEQPMQQQDPFEFTPPPVEGYYGQLLAETVANDPRTQQGQRDWRHDALDRFSQIRQKLDLVRSYINSEDIGAAQDVQQGMGVRDHVKNMRKNMADV